MLSVGFGGTSHNEMNKYQHTDAASMQILAAFFYLSSSPNRAISFYIFLILQKHTN